jgi:hypothetical protein
LRHIRRFIQQLVRQLRLAWDTARNTRHKIIKMEYGEAYTVVEKLPSDAMGMNYGD